MDSASRTLSLAADTLWLSRDVLDPGTVYGIRIEPRTSPAAIRYVADLVRAEALQLTMLFVGVNNFQAGSGPHELSRVWPYLGTVDEHLDEIIDGSPELVHLSLLGCPIRRVPDPIRQLRRINHMILVGLWPMQMPAWLFEMPVLRKLDVGCNGLSHLPLPAGSSSGSLRVLNLSSNHFTRIPSVVWKQVDLRSLDLSFCPIREIPADILRLRRLNNLDVGNSQSELAVPPPEITALGLTAIKNYWTQEKRSGLDYLAEAKLLIIGEAGAGKTTLAKKIVDAGYPLNPDESSTQGIGVHPWQFPASVRAGDAVGDRFVDREFRVNIWDFGGQEIYHATHQFFLTKRSVYVLVCDERKEDTDFQYWLDVVGLLSGGSPLLIVQNRKQGRGQALDLRTLREEYSNLVGVVCVDLSDNTGLDELIRKLRRELELLPHIGTVLPKTWQNVRLALEEDPRNYISAETFFQICAEHDFTREEDMRQLGGFLHDLGTCLFFQDDALLGKTVILKPEWGTDAVYRVLDDEEIIGRLGEFGPDDLRRIWPESMFQAMHGELVQLMVRFSLCFPVPGVTDRHLAPQLLSSVRPAYVWDEPGDLTLRYEYDVMPKGILRRLIVALHDLVDDNAVWRSGVVLRYETGRAEVIEDHHRRRLHIRLSGRDPRVMLSVIDRALTTIHRSYPDLRFERLRPCTCGSCAALAEPTMFSVRVLEDFARDGDRIQCAASRQLVDAGALLNELWLPENEVVATVRGAGPDEVFVSYKWDGAADSLVDEVVTRLGQRGLLVRRDRNEVRYRDSIRRFMRSLGSSRFVILVIDDAYLRSEKCMFELTEIADRSDFANRVFPIMLDDADIGKALGRLRYVKYWEGRRDELAEAMKSVGQENLQGIREELDLFEKIRNVVARLTDVLADMNAPSMQPGSDFEGLYRALEKARLTARES